MVLYQDWSKEMNKKCVSIILIVFFYLSSLFSFSERTNAVKENYVNKLFFFRDLDRFSLNLSQLSFLKQEGAIQEFEQFLGLNAIRIKATDDCFKLILDSNPNVTVVDDFIYKASPITLNNNSVDQEKQNWNLDLIHVREMWEKGFTGKGVKIGILDTGVDADHPALQGKIKDFAFIDKSGSSERIKDAYDTDSHGTHVSGIAVGGSLQKPLGVAPDSSLSVGVVIPGGSGSFSQIIGGLEWILNPDNDPLTNDSPRIVNLSLGLPGFVKIWTPIFQKLLAKNILPVCSIGNEGDGISSSPGNTPNAFAVGAYDSNKKCGFFSSGSDQIKWEDTTIQTDFYSKPDISAPGVSILSCIPDKGYEKMSGTSMASPHVAGAAAVLAQAFPEASSYDLRYFLMAGAQDEGKKGYDTRFGQGSLDVFNSFKLMTQAKRVQGKIKNYSIDYTLQIAETGLPVYINSHEDFSVYLPTGSYHLDIIYQQDKIKSLPLTITSKNIQLDIVLPIIQQFTLDGRVKDPMGNPLQASIVSKDNRIVTNKAGMFSIPCNALDSLIIRASGYKEETFHLGTTLPAFLNITLKKVDLLLIEGASNYLAIKNPPKLASNYYFEALNQNNISFAFQDATKEPLRWEDISGFKILLYFFESGSFTHEEGKLLSRYLEQGGKLLVTGRMVMFLENYMNLTFLGDYFGIASKETISFPSISTFDDADDFKGFQFALSGNEGANNQENCDVLQRRESSVSPIPFLKFTEIGKERYAGVLATNGIYRGVFLPFGFEGISSSSARKDLMLKMITWLNKTGSIEIDMPNDVPFYLELKKDNGPYLSAMVESGSFIQKNLAPGTYSIFVQGFGYESFEHIQYIGVNDYASFKIYPKKLPTQRVKIQLNAYNGMLSYLEVIFYQKSMFFHELKSQDFYSFDLPQGEYTFIVRSPLYETKFYQTQIKALDLEIKIDMKKNLRKILLVDDSETGDFLLDRYARIGSYYEKHLSQIPFSYEYWEVSQKGKPSFMDMLPYQAVLYVTGLKMVTLETQTEKDQIEQYLNIGGRILLTGNFNHTILQDTDFLHNYFGVEVKSSNNREQAIIGAPDSPFSDLKFDLVDTFGSSGIFVPFGSFRLLDRTVQPLLLYYSGEIASTYLRTNSYRTILIPFGIDNMTRSTLRIDVLRRMLTLLLSD